MLLTWFFATNQDAVKFPSLRYSSLPRSARLLRILDVLKSRLGLAYSDVEDVVVPARRDDSDLALRAHLLSVFDRIIATPGLGDGDVALDDPLQCVVRDHVVEVGLLTNDGDGEGGLFRGARVRYLYVYRVGMSGTALSNPGVDTYPQRQAHGRGGWRHQLTDK